MIGEATVLSEERTANRFPMSYLAKPIKAQELISKVEGATLVDVAQDFPKYLIKKDKANELKSKWTVPPPDLWAGWFMDEL